MRLCSHCGEEIPVVLCPTCGEDISELAYHSGEAYALADHADRKINDHDDGSHDEYL